MTPDQAQVILGTDLVAKTLLNSKALVRLAYVWPDGTPRVVPMWFHWTGDAVVMATSANAPKMQALSRAPDVALSIDSDAWPYQMLSIRGAASVELRDEMPAEMVLMAHHYFDEEIAEQFLPVLKEKVRRWLRITVSPHDVRILDFETRFPSAWSTGGESS